MSDTMMDQIDDDAVVISGISGSFPGCEDIEELKDNLISGTDCVTTDSCGWNIDHPYIPKRYGKMKNTDKFDNHFFGVHGKLSTLMDPMGRLLLERSYEAISDAGINPRDLRGENTVVFAGSSFSETEKSTFFEKLHKDGFGLIGSARAMLPNRVSFYLNLHGQSLNFDSLSAGSGMALEKAYRSIKDGTCDSAIVGGTGTCMFPYISLQLSRMKVLSSDGVHRAFDANASGSTRSEAVVAFFLQKASKAKRIYAEIAAIKTDAGESRFETNMLFPTMNFQARLMKETVEECGIRPQDVTYIEADGAGIKKCDIDELEAIDRVYGGNRTEPLLVGSVKSNIGDCYASNTLTSITKVIVAMKEGKIPPNLHFEKPPEEAKGLIEGRLKIVTELTPWKGRYAAVNTTSIGGTFVHVILKFHKIQRKTNRDGDMPRLVIASSRTEQGIADILHYLKTQPVNAEFCQLLNEIYMKSSTDYLYRGFAVLPPIGASTKPITDSTCISGEKKNIWYVFSGMGSQWVGMGTSLMKIPIFAKAIMKCDAVLKPRGYDIVRILTDDDPKMFNNIVHCFIGIAAVQIGLVDILNAVGIKPDYIIGHSVGELGCAYADGCFDAEQMILSSLSRGLASIETELIHGSMAAVGLGYNEIKPMCPHDIDIACRNSSKSVTISGPADSMKKFVASLQAKGIFAKEVPCGEIAYHSRYIEPAGKKLIQYLEKVIPNPKPRSSKWISTSVPRREWDTAKARLSSAEYHTNNLLCPVLFDEVLKTIPRGAILIEISPHGLLQAILRRAVHEECVNISLARRGNPDNVTTLLSALGKLYNAEVQIDIQNLYQRIDYPVSTETPLISPLIKWHHTTDWFVCRFQDKKYSTGLYVCKIDLSEEEFECLNDCKICGKVVLPYGFYLSYVLRIFENYGKGIEDSTCIFKDIRILQDLVIVPENEIFEITIMLQKGSGHFEVYHNEDLLMSGNMLVEKSPEIPEEIIVRTIDEKNILPRDYVYKELFMRGAEYKNSFQCIDTINRIDMCGYMTWEDNLTSFLEGLIQFQAFCETRPRLRIPRHILQIVIDRKLHKEITKKTNRIPVHFDQITNKIVAGGIEVSGLKLSTINKQPSGTNIITEGIQFVSHRDDDVISLEKIVQLVIELIAENLPRRKEVNDIVIVSEEDGDMVEALNYLKNILQSIEGTFNISVLSSKEIVQTIDNMENIERMKKAALIVVDNIHETAKAHLLNNLNNTNFLLTIVDQENERNVLSTIEKANTCLVVKKRISSGKIFVLFRTKQLPKNPLIIEIQDNSILQVRDGLNNPNYDRVIVLIRNDNDDKILANLRKLRSESNGEKLQVFDLKDVLNVPAFSIQDPLYKIQLQLNLFINVLKSHDVWGSVRKLPVSLNSSMVSRWVAKQLIPADPRSVECVEVLPHDEKEREKSVKVEYSGFCTEDLRQVYSEEVRSFSKTYQDESFGLDYSGVDSAGQRIMGIASEGSTTNVLLSDSVFKWPIPNSWSLEDAATVPTAYVVAYFSLFTCSDLKVDKNVLVHRPASDIGQAIIHLALSVNYDVVATYTHESEKIILEATFPNEGRLNIIPQANFVDYILWKNHGRNVDIGICYADDLSVISDTRFCTAEGQYLLIIGNIVDNIHGSIGMREFLKGLHIHTLNPKSLTRMNTDKKIMLANMLKKGIESGIVKPIVKRWIYPVESLINAFDDPDSKIRHGKVLIKIQSREQSTLAISRAFFSSAKAYVVIDGLNDFGLRIMGWLICKGVRKLIVTSHGSAHEYATYCLAKWRQRGISVSTHENVNLSNRKNVQMLFQNVRQFGEVEGIFDLQRMNSKSVDVSSFSTSTKILDEESRSSFPNLKYFVVSCSVKFEDVISDFATRDMVAQRVCERRKSDGLPGLMILWGPIRQTDQTENKMKGVNYIEISQCLTQLDGLLKSNIPIVAVFGREEVEEEKEVIQEEIELDEEEIFRRSLYIPMNMTSGIFSNVPVE